MEKSSGQVRPGLVLNWGIDLALQSLFVALGIYLLREPMGGRTRVGYLLIVGFLIRGLVSMAVYVFKGHYRSLGNDSFRSGLLLTLVCVLAAIRMQVVAERFPLLLGALFLYVAAGIAQSALQILLLKRKFWYLPLLFALLTAICAFILILDPAGMISDRIKRAYIAMICVGVMGIFSQILSLLQLLITRHLERRERRQMQEENRNFMADEETEVISADEDTPEEMSEDALQVLPEDKSQ